jgi:kinetochore protein Nuf2
LACPQPKRFRRQLSALINFLKYREDMAYLKLQAYDEREELFAALDEVTDQHMSLKDQLDTVRCVNEEQHALRTEAEMECKEMENEIAQQNKIQVSLRQETYLLKKTANGLQEEVANMELALREVKAEERILRKEVVSSPDQIKITLADATSRLNEVKRRIVDRVNDKALVQKRIDNTNIALDGGGGGDKETELGSGGSSSSMTHILHTMDTLDMSVQDYEIVKEDMENANQMVTTIEEDKSRILVEMTNQQTKLDLIEKEKVDTSTQLTNTLRTVQDELTTATTKLNSVESELVVGMKKIDTCVERNTKLETMIHREKERCEASIAQHVSSFYKFEESYLMSEEKLHSSLPSPRGVDDVILRRD